MSNQNHPTYAAEVAEGMKQSAHQNDRSLNGEIVRALRVYLANKTFQYTLKPTPEQERTLEEVLWQCRLLYNCALEQRLTWWRRGQGKSATRYQQEAELKELRAAFQEYAFIHSHILQDVLTLLDRTYQAFFRRLASGEQPGFPRFQG